MELNLAQVNIRDLVAQVKSGQKNKNEAFKELQNILKQSTGSTTIASESANEEEDNDALSSNSIGGRISQEDRRLLINKLIEQKRQARAEAENELKDEQTQGSNSYPSGTPQNKNQYETGNDQVWSGSREAAGSGTRPRSASAGRGGYMMGGKNDSSYYTRRSADDSAIYRDSRSNRIAQTEAAIRHEMFKDCTFRPKIKPLPSHYGSQKEDDSDFYERVIRWQKEKDQGAARRKSMTDSSAIVDCTFKPKLNRNSLRAVQELRGNANEDTSDRLYKNHELSILQRSKYIEEELARERVLETEECTFKPNISISNTEKFKQVRCKVSAQPKKHQYDSSQHPESKHCTFTPKVKGVGAHMNSAQVYVSTNVVDRLTRPVIQNADAAAGTVGGTVLDMTSFMGALNSSGASAATFSRTPGKGGDKGAEKVKHMDKKTLENFLGRQEQCSIRREKHIESGRKSIEPKFQPKLCKKSSVLSERTHKGTFLERVERDVLRRTDHEIRAAVIPDESCTFQPSITHKSEKLRARTVYEMSRGDLLKRETNNRMMRMRSDQEELQEMTFKPEITKKGKQAAAQKISLTHDPAKFLDLQKEKAQRKESERLALLEKREKEELEKCTFAPATKDCPAYVRRIAKSMAVVRAARTTPEEAQDNQKPTWK